VLESDAGGVVPGLETPDEVVNAVVEDVVAEIDHEVVVADEVAGAGDGVRESERPPLHDVGDINAEPRAISQEFLDRFPALVAEDDADFIDAGISEVLDPILEHGLVGDWDELFRPGMGGGASRCHRRGRRPSFVRLRLPVQRDSVGVVGESLLVRVLVVVQFGREVDEYRGLVPDGLEPVPARSRDADDLLVVLADDERIVLALGRRVLSVVVDADLDAAFRTNEVVHLAARVAVPRPDDAGIGERVVRHGGVGFEDIPILAIGFDEVAAFVCVHLEVTDIDIVNHNFIQSMHPFSFTDYDSSTISILI